MKYAIPFCLTALLLLPVLAPAQSKLFPGDQSTRIRQGIQDIYSMEYSRAAGTFQRMIQGAPDDPAGYTYLAMTYWIQELATKQELSIDRFAASDFFVENPKFRPKVDPAAEERFREVDQQAIEKATARLAGNPDDRAALFLRGLAYQNLASFEASLKRSWWAAFRAGTKTYRDHKELLRRDPNLYDTYLSIGVYDYVAGSLPWSVKWLAFLLGHTGDKTRGKRQIELAADKAALTADDARIILILINTREKNYEKAFDYLSQLQHKYPQNYLVWLDMGGMALLMDKPDRAIAIYREILSKREARERNYADIERAMLYVRLGVAFRHKTDLETSAAWFRKALEEDGLSARSATVAHLELGKTLDLMGRRDEALKNYQAVASTEDIAGTQQEAQTLLRKPFTG